MIAVSAIRKFCYNGVVDETNTLGVNAMITVIIPVLNESPTIASVVQFASKANGVTEVIVIDDGSIDGTPDEARSAGARVVTSTLLGKGASMEDGMWAAQNDILLYLDGDLAG